MAQVTHPTPPHPPALLLWQPASDLTVVGPLSPAPLNATHHMPERITCHSASPNALSRPGSSALGFSGVPVVEDAALRRVRRVRAERGQAHTPVVPVLVALSGVRWRTVARAGL